jgi:hypothetical protein
MSTIQNVNFEPVSDMMSVVRRNYPLADKTLIQPNNAVVLVDGEWMTINSAGKLLRATTIGSLGDEPGNYTFILVPSWAERGRTDIQASADKVYPVLWMGSYEFDTRVFDAAATVGTGAPITQIGQPLKVATIAIGGRNFTGLVGAVYNEAAPAKFVGYVTRLPAQNNGKLRFMTGWRR